MGWKVLKLWAFLRNVRQHQSRPRDHRGHDRGHADAEGERARKDGTRTFKVEREHIIQQWFLQRELRIAVNIENDSGSLLLRRKRLSSIRSYASVLNSGCGV